MEYGIDGCLAYCDGDSQGVSETIAELDYDSEVEAAEEACMVFCYETLGMYGTAPLSSLQACWETCVEDQSGDVWSCAVGF